MPLTKVPQLAEGQRKQDGEPWDPRLRILPLLPWVLVHLTVSSELIAGSMNKYIWWPWYPAAGGHKINHPMWRAMWQSRVTHLRKECTPLTLTLCRWELVLEGWSKACWVSRMFTVILYSKMILPSSLLFLPFFFLSRSSLSFSPSFYRVGDLSHGLTLATEVCLQPPKRSFLK